MRSDVNFYFIVAPRVTDKFQKLKKEREMELLDIRMTHIIAEDKLSNYLSSGNDAKARERREQLESSLATGHLSAAGCINLI